MAKGDIINPYKRFVGSFVPNWLLRREEISLGAKLLYARLCQYAGESGIARPDQKELATELGMKDRNVRNLLTELISCELIQCERPGLGEPNRYSFLDHEWFTDERHTSATPDRQNIATHEQTRVPPDRQRIATPDRQDPATPFNIENHKDREDTKNIYIPRLIEIEEPWKEIIETLHRIPKWDNSKDIALLQWLTSKRVDSRGALDTALSLVSKWEKYKRQEPYATFQAWINRGRKEEPAQATNDWVNQNRFASESDSALPSKGKQSKEWEKALEELKLQLSRPLFTGFLKGSIGWISEDKQTFYIELPKVQHAEWVEKRVRPLIEKTLTGILSREIRIEVLVKQEVA